MAKKYVYDKNRFYRKVIIEPLTRSNVKEISDDGERIININDKKKLVSQSKRKNIGKAVETRNMKKEVIKMKPDVDVSKNKIKHKNLYKRIGKIEPIFKDNTIFLIGGGPSLKDFDFKRLKGKRTIAINKAFLFYPEADALYWTDSRFYTWYKDDINKFKGMKVTNKPKPNRHDIINLQDTGRDGLEMRPTAIRHGNNSGYAAINLAVHLGANRIVLLGYDMKMLNKVTHWHDGYDIVQSPNVYARSMLPYFDGLVNPLHELDIEVYNGNLDSAIKCFPRINLDVALNL